MGGVKHYERKGSVPDVSAPSSEEEKKSERSVISCFNTIPTHTSCSASPPCYSHTYLQVRNRVSLSVCLYNSDR